MTFLKSMPKIAAALGVALMLAGCGVNNIPTKDQAVKARLADVQASYQRRADLIPNLVNTVQGYARQEQSVLVAVTQARASATQVKLDASTITDPQAFARFQQAQDQLSGVLGRQRVLSLGDFTDCRHSVYDNGYGLAEGFAQIRRVAGIPVLDGLPFGHAPDKFTLPFGVPARLRVDGGRARLDFTGYPHIG